VQMVMVPDAAPVFSFLSSWPVGAASYFSAAIVSSLLASLVLATHTVPTRPALVAGGDAGFYHTACRSLLQVAGECRAF